MKKTVQRYKVMLFVDSAKHILRYGTIGIEGEIKGSHVACFARIVAVAYEKIPVVSQENGMGTFACKIQDERSPKKLGILFH